MPHRKTRTRDPDVVGRTMDAAVGALDKHLGAHHFLYCEDDAILAFDRYGSPAKRKLCQAVRFASQTANPFLHMSISRGPHRPNTRRTNEAAGATPNPSISRASNAFLRGSASPRPRVSPRPRANFSPRRRLGAYRLCSRCIKPRTSRSNVHPGPSSLGSSRVARGGRTSKEGSGSSSPAVVDGLAGVLDLENATIRRKGGGRQIVLPARKPLSGTPAFTARFPAPHPAPRTRNTCTAHSRLTPVPMEDIGEASG